jgi:hypothetical protein
MQFLVYIKCYAERHNSKVYHDRAFYWPLNTSGSHNLQS